MATISGQLKDASVKGKPRDLMNIIFNVAPTDTPFLTMCGKSKAVQTLHEWQTDTLADPKENSALEGADVKDFVASATTELSNKTQILSTAINVSATAQAIEQAGVDKQYNYQMALRTKELKKDVEFALLQNKLERADARPADVDADQLECGSFHRCHRCAQLQGLYGRNGPRA